LKRRPTLEIPESIGPYRVLSKVGEGGMGVVYKEDQRLGRVVALKVIHEFEGGSSRRSRFWQEARAAAQVSHPNACQIYDIAEEQDRLVLCKWRRARAPGLALRGLLGPVLPAVPCGSLPLFHAEIPLPEVLNGA